MAVGGSHTHKHTHISCLHPPSSFPIIFKCYRIKVVQHVCYKIKRVFSHIAYMLLELCIKNWHHLCVWSSRCVWCACHWHWGLVWKSDLKNSTPLSWGWKSAGHASHSSSTLVYFSAFPDSKASSQGCFSSDSNCILQGFMVNTVGEWKEEHFFRFLPTFTLQAQIVTLQCLFIAFYYALY